MFTDDFYWLETGRTLSNSYADIISHRFFNYWRPLVTFSFIAENFFYGSHAAAHHLCNAILHVLSIVNIYLLSSRIFRNTATPFLIAILFGISAASSDTIFWISGRSDLLAGLFLLTALNLTQKKSRNRQSLLNAFTLISLCLAFLSKESTILFPLWLLILDRATSVDSTGSLHPFSIKTWISNRKYILILTTLFLTIHVAIQIRSGPYLAEFGKPLFGTHFLQNLLQGVVYTVFAPLPFLFETDPGGWISGGLLFIATVLVVYLSGKTTRMALAWIILAIIPVAVVPFSFLPKPWFTFGRFFYMASIGAAVFWGTVFEVIFRNSGRIIRWMVVMGAVIFIAVSAIRTVNNKELWEQVGSVRKTAMDQLNDVISKVPEATPVTILSPPEEFQHEMIRVFAQRPVKVLPVENTDITAIKGAVFYYHQGKIQSLR